MGEAVLFVTIVTILFAFIVAIVTVVAVVIVVGDSLVHIVEVGRRIDDLWLADVVLAFVIIIITGTVESLSLAVPVMSSDGVDSFELGRWCFLGLGLGRCRVDHVIEFAEHVLQYFKDTSTAILEAQRSIVIFIVIIVILVVAVVAGVITGVIIGINIGITGILAVVVAGVIPTIGIRNLIVGINIGITGIVVVAVVVAGVIPSIGVRNILIGINIGINTGIPVVAVVVASVIPRIGVRNIIIDIVGRRVARGGYAVGPVLSCD
ncbi:hypothetical protein PG993_009071 [Apiospora rasikravindrae]|uniref:Uncharacterized protein n=1 Tax=Apiospora rasikravindrae TaxID=990691 RepID=A0ABR1SIC3_9PEZI